jgi:hypothetical protein
MAAKHVDHSYKNVHYLRTAKKNDILQKTSK